MRRCVFLCIILDVSKDLIACIFRAKLKAQQPCSLSTSPHETFAFLYIILDVSKDLIACIFRAKLKAQQPCLLSTSAHATLCLFVYNIGRFEGFNCLHLQGEAEGATALFVKYIP